MPDSTMSHNKSDFRMSDSRRGFRRSRGERLPIIELLRVVHRYRYVFLVFTLSVVMAAIIDHFAFPVFKARAGIAIQSPGNSASQAISARLGGFGPTEAYVSQTPAERYILSLRTYEFYRMAAKALLETEVAKTLDLSVFSARQAFLYRVRKLALGPEKLRMEKQRPEERLAEDIAAHTSIAPSGPDMISISATAPVMKLTQVLAKVLAEQAVVAILLQEERELDDSEKYIKVQIAETEREIARIDNDIAVSKKLSLGDSLTVAKEDGVRRALTLQDQITGLTIDIEHAQAKIESLSKSLEKMNEGREPASVEAFNYKFGIPERLNRLKRLHEEMVKRRDMANKFFENMVGKYDLHYEQKEFGLRRKLELQYTFFENLRKEMFQNDVRRISVKNTVRVYETPREESVRREHSIEAKIFFAIILSLLISAPLVYIWEVLVPTIKSTGDLDELGLGYLGSIPDFRSSPGLFGRKLKSQEGLIVRPELETPLSIAITGVRTRLTSVTERASEKCQLITVASGDAEEGKTFVSMNLAASLAFRKHRTLLIDADLRRRGVSTYFGVSKGAGLAEVLMGNTKFGAVVVRGVASGLDVLPSGLDRKHVSELLAGDSFPQLLLDLREIYDHIVIDTPPVSLFPDTSLVARHTEQLILVARQYRTKLSSLISTVNTIHEAHPKRTFVVLNRFRSVGSNVYYVVPREFQAETGARAQGKPS